jgi:hypothetical protein
LAGWHGACNHTDRTEVPLSRNVLVFCLSPLALSACSSGGFASIDTTDCPQAGDFIDFTGFSISGQGDPEMSVYCEGDALVVESNGLPNFEFVPMTPNDLSAQDYVWEIPATPAEGASPEDIPLLGPVAVAVNGLPVYGPNEAGDLGYGDPYLDGILDFCSGHTGAVGDYHFHARPDCLFDDMNGQTSLVVAYAFDGYPVLAPFACADEGCSSTYAVESSWQKTSDAAAAWDAHEYVAGAGDLDACNGLVREDGSYAYYATDTFPYLLGCYRGQADPPEMVGP